MTKEIKITIEKAVSVLNSFGATNVYLFGSVAKGTAHHDSDIDLAVSGIPSKKFFEAMGETFFAINREIDIVDLDDKTNFVEYLKSHGELKRVG